MCIATRPWSSEKAFSFVFPVTGSCVPCRTIWPTSSSREVLGLDRGYLSEAERLVACFEKIVDGDLDRIPRLADAEFREAQATVRHRTQAIDRSDIAKVCAAWREMQARWKKIPVGESIRIEWRSVRALGKEHRR